MRWCSTRHLRAAGQDMVTQWVVYRALDDAGGQADPLEQGRAAWEHIFGPAQAPAAAHRGDKRRRGHAEHQRSTSVTLDTPAVQLHSLT